MVIAIASLHRADVFWIHVRLGGHCREFGVILCSNSAPTSALGKVNALFETQASHNSYYIFKQLTSESRYMCKSQNYWVSTDWLLESYNIWTLPLMMEQGLLCALWCSKNVVLTLAGANRNVWVNYMHDMLTCFWNRACFVCLALSHFAALHGETPILRRPANSVHSKTSVQIMLLITHWFCWPLHCQWQCRVQTTASRQALWPP